jgi:hypothetical protein
MKVFLEVKNHVEICTCFVATMDDEPNVKAYPPPSLFVAHEI